jgi:DNA (cytosine-5)-methyltransferase 1
VILERLRKLNYFVHYKVLNGLDFGVPQKRERIIIVGFKENYPFEFPTGPIRKVVSLKEVIEPHGRVDKRYFISERLKEKIAKRVEKNPYSPSIWHENKAGHIGIHPFSCALRANASYNYLLVDGVRRPTAREMFRLQGFPETFKINVPETQARKQAGNAVVVPKMEAVAAAMVKAMTMKPLKIAQQADLFNQDIKKIAYA